MTVSARVALLLALPLCLPIFTIIALAAGADLSAWPHLWRNVLPTMMWTTLLFCSGTALVTLVVGTSLAWLVTMHDFPLRSVLQWTLILPLAMPGYITSFVYVDTFDYAGPVRTALRGFMGWSSPTDYVFPDIRSLPGAILVMSAALYPYVYMTARAALLRQPMTQIDVARSLGRSATRAFFEVTLPQARPAIAVGSALVVMECLNDMGAVGFFGINTLTLAVYTTWLGQGDINTAAQLAMVLLTTVAALVFFEQSMRRRDHLSRAARSPGVVRRTSLKGKRGLLATLTCALPLFLGFLLPLMLLIDFSRNHWDDAFAGGFIVAAANSALLALAACIFTLLLALFFGYANRRSGARWLSATTKISALGYAMPGTILAIGVLVPFGALDRWLNSVTVWIFDWLPGLVLSGSVFALVFALTLRFLIVASGSVETGLMKISPHFEEVAQTLGRPPWRAFIDIHLPMLRPALVAAALLVFVDAMKELPATLLLRPFDFETLATQVYALASLGQLEDAAVPSLVIVAVGLLPIAILAHAVRDAAQA